MAHWKDVIAETLQPNDKLGSVIDVYMALGEILETRRKIAKGEYFSKEDFDKSILHAMFSLGFMPFWNAHGAGIRPLFIQALQSEKESFIEDFFIEAVAFALTAAMPLRQKEYAEIRNLVREKFKKG
jgi:hypothetical protein